jgi:transglutaminase/protease-like cytokinesis protein 3
MDAVSVLEHPSTVCSGYSNLTAALLRAANIRTRVISGTAKTEDGYGGHAWNEVLVNSEWKSLDVTWDDVENLRYDYFLPSSSVFEQDHRKEEIKENY